MRRGEDGTRTWLEELCKLYTWTSAAEGDACEVRTHSQAHTLTRTHTHTHTHSHAHMSTCDVFVAACNTVLEISLCKYFVWCTREGKSYDERDIWRLNKHECLSNCLLA